MERNERNEKITDFLWRTGVTAGLFAFTIFTMLTLIGCGDNRITPAAATASSSTSTTSTDISVGNDSELALVKQYATQSDGYFYHWKTGSVVTVWNGANVGSFQQILSTVNSVLNGKLTLIATDSESSADIKIYEDNSVDGITRGAPGLTVVEIRIRVNGMNNHAGTISTLIHELFHAIGFWNHTNDYGIMDLNLGDGSTISSIVRITLSKLYDLPMYGRLV